MTRIAETPETRLNVRLAGPLADHVNRRVETALYNTHSEYIRDLVRRDMEAEIRASIQSAEEDIAAGRFTPLGTKEETLARLKANNAANKKKQRS